MAEDEGHLGDVFGLRACQFLTSVKNDEVRTNVACERAEVQERWKMSLMIVDIDVRETTNRFVQRRGGKYVVLISWFYEMLNDLQSMSQAAREPKDLCDIARCALVFYVYLAQFS